MQSSAPLVPLASLDLPNQGRRVACGSSEPGFKRQNICETMTPVQKDNYFT
jgi:hypothetical protein